MISFLFFDLYVIAAIGYANAAFLSSTASSHVLLASPLPNSVSPSGMRNVPNFALAKNQDSISFPKKDFCISATLERKKAAEAITVPFLPRGGQFVAGQEIVTIGQGLAGAAFSSLVILKGLVFILAPDIMSQLYGVQSSKEDGRNIDDDHKPVIHLITQSIGTVALSIGLTSALAMRSELKLFGHLPSPSSIHQSICIGLIPYFALLPQYLSMKFPTRLRVWRKSSVVGTIVFFAGAYLITIKKAATSLALNLILAKTALFGPLIFFRPSIIFKKQYQNGISKEETIMTRVFGMYCILYAVLLGGLRHPLINVFPAIGFTSLTWSMAQLYLVVVTKYIEKCDCSTPSHLALISAGFAMAAGGLRHYLIM